MKTMPLALAVAAALFGQTQSKPPATTAPKPAAQTAPKETSGVDAIIALVKAKMSESLVIKTIQREGKPYNLAPAEMLKLQQAGFCEPLQIHYRKKRISG